MFDPRALVSIPEVPGLIVHADDRTAEAYYALPAVPRIASDELGQPQIALALYGRRRPDGAFDTTGGVLTLTTTLQLGAEEERRLVAAWLQRLLAARPPENRADAPRPRPQRLGVDWLEAEVSLALTADIVLAGRPSLTGGNECAFNVRLDAGRAQALRQAWDNGLPDALITYRGRVRAAGGEATTAAASETRREHVAGDGYRSIRTTTLSFSTSQGAASAPYPVTLSGRLVVPDPAARLQLLGL